MAYMVVMAMVMDIVVMVMVMDIVVMVMVLVYVMDIVVMVMVTVLAMVATMTTVKVMVIEVQTISPNLRGVGLVLQKRIHQRAHTVLVVTSEVRRARGGEG